ncbi:MAG TPA: DinB family protein [Bryobacteraceae bacterium]|nr:DinB family protein [Bryobacteraceae bacterium]
MNPAEAKSIAGMLLGGLEREYATTLRVLSAVPDKQLDFKLGDKGRTARELAWHLAASEMWFAKAIASGNFTYEETPMPLEVTTAGIVALYQKEVPAGFERIKALPGEQLAKEVDFFGVMKMPSVMYLSSWNNHSIHHRGQLSAYLRAMNAHVPSIYGGSADEPFQMPASA